jgi:FkbM family methyltransferase
MKFWEDFKKIAPGCKCFVDIGAQQGQYAKLSDDIMKDAKIYSIEPHTTYFNNLKKWQNKPSANKKVAINKIISDEIGKGKLYIDYGSPVVDNKLKRDWIGRESRFITVNMTTLDEEFKDILDEIDLVKMDVEGYENHILRGSQELLKRNVKYWFVEVHDSLLEKINEDKKYLFDTFEKHGYKANHIYTKGPGESKRNETFSYYIFEK